MPAADAPVDLYAGAFVPPFSPKGRQLRRRLNDLYACASVWLIGWWVHKFPQKMKNIRKTAPVYKSTGCKKSSVPVEEKTPTRRASLQVDRLQNNSLQTEQKTNQAEPAYKPRCAIGGRPRPDGEPAYLSRRTKKEKIKKAKKKSCCRLAYLKRQ